MQRWVVPAIPEYVSDGWTPWRGLLKGLTLSTLLALLLAGGTVYWRGTLNRSADYRPTDK